MTSGKLRFHTMVHILVLSINNEAACLSISLSNRSKEWNHSSISFVQASIPIFKLQGTNGFFLPACCCSLGWPGESLGLRTTPLAILSVCGHGVGSHGLFFTAHTQCRWSVWSPAVSSRWRRLSETLGHKETSYQSTVQRWANLSFIILWLPIFRLVCAYYWSQHGISCDSWWRRAVVHVDTIIQSCC